MLLFVLALFIPSPSHAVVFLTRTQNLIRSLNRKKYSRSVFYENFLLFYVVFPFSFFFTHRSHVERAQHMNVDLRKEKSSDVCVSFEISNGVLVVEEGIFFCVRNHQQVAHLRIYSLAFRNGFLFIYQFLLLPSESDS